MKGTDWPWRSTFLWCRHPCSQSFSEENGRVESPGDEVVVPLALKRCRVSERPDLQYLDNASPLSIFSREREHWYTHSPSHQLIAFFLNIQQTTLETRFECIAVIWLQILRVSRRTHLVKNHESQSRTNESHFKKKRSSKLKMLGPLCNQTVNLKTDSKTLYYSLLKLKYSPSILKHNKG